MIIKSLTPLDEDNFIVSYAGEKKTPEEAMKEVAAKFPHAELTGIYYDRSNENQTIYDFEVKE